MEMKHIQNFENTGVHVFLEVIINTLSSSAYNKHEKKCHSIQIGLIFFFFFFAFHFVAILAYT